MDLLILKLFRDNFASASASASCSHNMPVSNDISIECDAVKIS